MLRKPAIQRTLAAYLLTALFFGLNLCVVESAFAQDVCAGTDTDQPSSYDCGHHADQGSKDKSQSEDQTCCSNLLAVTPFLKSTFLLDLAVKSALPLNIFSKTAHDFYSLGGDYFINPSFGKSPPPVFLLTYFTHAPPVSLH